MEKVIFVHYKAEDGKLFNTEAECKQYEQEYYTIEYIMSKLVPLPKNLSQDFIYGKEYIQHDPSIVKLLRQELLWLALQKPIPIPEEYQRVLKEGLANLSLCTPCGGVSWVISDIVGQPIKRAWWRVTCCIDKFGREWGQPYFAISAEKGIDKQIT